jgi:hypothetical protein
MIETSNPIAVRAPSCSDPAMLGSAPYAGLAARQRPSLLRLILGLFVASPIPALLIAALGVTHEIWIASAATTTMFYTLFAMTGIVRLSVHDASRWSNLLRASRVGAFIAIAIALGFVGFYLFLLPELILSICAMLGVAGAVSGALFWWCVYA